MVRASSSQMVRPDADAARCGNFYERSFFYSEHRCTGKYYEPQQISLDIICYCALCGVGAPDGWFSHYSRTYHAHRYPVSVADSPWGRDICEFAAWVFYGKLGVVIFAGSAVYAG